MRAFAALALRLLPAIVLLAACASGGIPSPRAQQFLPPATVAPTPHSPPSPTPSQTATPAPTASPTSTPSPLPTKTATPPPQYAPSGLIERGPRSSSKVAFTFDLGSGAGATLAVLAALKTHEVPATFFVTGQWAELNPGLLKAIVAGGHAVANHSYSHPDFTQLGREAMLEELAKTEQAVQRIAGVSTRPYWRPPFGALNAIVLRVVAEGGYEAVYWTLDSTDWREDSTTASITARVLKYVEPGAIIVMHGSVPKTALALPELIQQMRARGLQPTSLADLLEHP